MRIFVCLVVVISLVGIVGSFLPWINYPRIDLVVNGYQGDGWIIAFLFTMIILFSVIALLIARFRQVSFLSALFFNILITLLIYSKIDTFWEEKLNFNSDDPYLITAVAGSHIAYGLYMVGVSSLLNSLICMGYFIQKVIK